MADVKCVSCIFYMCVNSEAVCLPAVMKGTMLICAAVCLLFCWMQPVGSMKVGGTFNRVTSTLCDNPWECLKFDVY